MNNIEAKIKELGLPITFYEEKGRVWPKVLGGYIKVEVPENFPNGIWLANFNGIDQAYNWIAKEFHLDNLVSLEELEKCKSGAAELFSIINKLRKERLNLVSKDEVKEYIEKKGEHIIQGDYNKYIDVDELHDWLEDK